MASQLDTVTNGTNTATYAYLPNSPLVGSVTFAQGGAIRLTTTKVYDNLNRLSSIVSQPSALNSQLSAAYTYNTANQRTRATREDGAHWDYTYDALGQVTSGKKYLGGGTPINGLDHAWTFDDIGNRKTATTNSQISNYTANALNQYSQRTVPGVFDVMGEAQPDATVTLTVNGGAPQPVTRQGGLFFKQVPVDNAVAAQPTTIKVTGVKNLVGPNQEDAVTDIPRSAFTAQSPEVFTHDADGNLTGDARWTYTWDGENRLIRLTAQAGVVRAEHRPRLIEFAYDGQGRRVAKKATQSPATGVEWNVTYYSQPYFGGTATPPVPAGALNLVNLSGGTIMSAIWEGKVTVPTTGSWTFKLQESAWYGYRFYLDGVKRFEAWPELGTDQTQSVTLNLEAGREYPIKLEFSIRADWRWWMTANVNLKWAGPGTPEELVPAAWSGVPDAQDTVTTTRFLYDGWNLLAEVDEAGAAVRTYVWGSDLSGSLQGAGGVGGLLFSTYSLNLTPYSAAAAFDGNGNVIGYVDMATGAKSATYEYSAFGETLIADGPAAELFPFRFSTKYRDAETSLVYYGLRYKGDYGWISRDPVGEYGGENLYGFLSNDAINGYDLLGLFKPRYHQSFTEVGLANTGIPKGAIDVIAVANVGQDEGAGLGWIPPQMGPFFDPVNHGDDSRIDEAISRIAQRFRNAINAQCIDCEKVRAMLQEFGRALHGVQDLYAHSNFVEEYGRNAKTPDETPLWKLWQKNGNTPNVPPGVITGTYRYPRDNAPAPSHLQLNKDAPDSLRGGQRNPQGVSLFEQAASAATRHTERLGKHLYDNLTPEQRAKLLECFK